MSVKTVSLPQAGITVKLGRKRPAVPPKTLKLRRYLLKDLPPPPSSADWATPVKSWPMYMNNKIGDCTAAAGGHEIGCFTANTASLRRLCDAGRASQGETGTETVFTDDQIVSVYSAISGYVPGDESTDNGASVTDLLNYWQQTGYPQVGTDTANHTIAGYVAVDGTNNTEIQQAIDLFGTLTIGFDLPDAWIKSFQGDGSDVWDVGPGIAPDPNNGHCIPFVAYDAEGVTAVTWGAVVKITWSAVAMILDPNNGGECYAKVSTDWASGTMPAPNGVDLATLNSDLAALNGEPPSPNPPVPPAPVPPAPVPTPPMPIAVVEEVVGKLIADGLPIRKIARLLPTIYMDALRGMTAAEIIAALSTLSTALQRDAAESKFPHPLERLLVSHAKTYLVNRAISLGMPAELVNAHAAAGNWQQIVQWIIQNLPQIAAEVVQIMTVVAQLISLFGG
jgi:hypothetical protein